MFFISQTTRLITENAKNVRDLIKIEIKSIYEKYGGSMSMDCWTDKSRKLCYFGFTLHYISEENDKLLLNDRLLLIRELTEESKDGDYLQVKLLEYLVEFGIMQCVESEKLVFVSDRGTNIRAALRSYESICCMAHMIHNVVEKILHKNPIVAAVSSIVRYFKASGQSAMFEQTLKSLVPTRWNSVHTMFKSVIRHWNEIVEILQRRRTHLDDLSSISLEELKLIHDFLEPFATATLEIEATKKPTLDTVCPWFKLLQNHLTYKRTDPKLIADFKEVGYKYWTDNVSKHIYVFHQIAVFLNPALKSLKQFSALEKTRIYDKTMEMMESYQPMASNSESNERAEGTPRANISDALAAFADDDEDNAESNLIADEINEYKNMRIGAFESVLIWWQQNKFRLPRLYGVARFVFAIPASSAAPERVFSRAGKLVSHRPNLIPEHVDDILFLKSNFDLFVKNKRCSGSLPQEVNNNNINNEDLIEVNENDEGIDCLIDF